MDGQMLTSAHWKDAPSRTSGLPIESNPSPEVWAALLAGARLRRVRNRGQHPAPPAVEGGSIDGVLVRAYVLPEDEQTWRLASPPRKAW